MTSHSRGTVNQLQQLHTTETKSLMEKLCKNPKEHNSLQNLNHQITLFFRAITSQCRNQNDFQLHEAEPPTNFAQAQALADAHGSI